jgi:hypothetical protein
MMNASHLYCWSVTRLKAINAVLHQEPLKIPFLSYRRGRGLQEVKDISNMPSLDPLPHLPECTIRLNRSKALPYVLLVTHHSPLTTRRSLLTTRRSLLVALIPFLTLPSFQCREMCNDPKERRPFRLQFPLFFRGRCIINPIIHSKGDNP